MSEPGFRASIAAIIGKRLGGAALSSHALLDATDAVLAHLREQGWQSPDLAKKEADVYRRNVEALMQAERARDALQAECQRLKGLADLPGEHVNPLPAIVADYQARVRAEVKAGRVPIKPSH